MDSTVLARDPRATTVLAAHLNAAMARDAGARTRYLALYGEEWSAIGDGTEDHDDRIETENASSQAATRVY